MESAALEIIPTLTGKPFEEARQKAENYGFTFDVKEYETSATVPYGSVVLQTPESGTRARKGTAIYVTVSLGPDAPTMPDLLGMTPEEAKTALEQAGLYLGTTQYRTSDTEIGYVCAQSLVAGSEITPGTKVDIWISATSASTFEMPEVTDEILNLALSTLSDLAFENVFIRYDASSSAETGLVLHQEPEAGTEVVTSTALYLTVSGARNYPFSADVAFNLDIESNDTPVTCLLKEAYNGFAYNQIVYEHTLEKGDKVPVSFTAYSETEGGRELILLVGGKEVKRQEIVFVGKGS